MNAIQALSLRKPDVRNSSSIVSASASDAGSRFSKRSNIKEILVRNFFRKYPISGSISDVEQLQIERKVAGEIDKFVVTCPQINSKNLHEFESKLAGEVNLSKRLLATRTTDQAIGRNGGDVNLQK